MLGHLAGAVGPIVRLPMALVTGVEPLLENLSAVATRALALLDDVESIPGRIRELLERVEGVADQVEGVIGRADGLTGKVDGVVDDAAGTLAGVQPAVSVIAALDLSVLDVLPALLEDLSVLLAGVRQLDPSLLEAGTRAVRNAPQLMQTVESDLLPALAKLESLVPVVAQLGVHVNQLEATVADVGALLAGIPGAARLLKRGATPRASHPTT